MSDSEQITVYQLKIFILGISPTIWRRIKVRSDNTIVDLHYIIQIVMGWTYSHLAPIHKGEHPTFYVLRVDKKWDAPEELELLLKSSPSLKIPHELKEELITIYNSNITASDGMRTIKKRMQSRCR